MNEQFHALPLKWQCARAAYPLVQMHDASITLDKWLRFVRLKCAAVSSRAGLIAIRDCRSIVHAVYSYRVDIDLRIHKQLCIANLIVAHLPGSQIDDAVAASAQDVSAQFDCKTITIEQPFRSKGDSLGRCPTADLFRTGREAEIGARRH